MAVTVRAGRTLGMTGRMRRATPRILTSWAKGQVGRLKGAYQAGGHQRHGGKPWFPKKGFGRLLLKTGAMRRKTGSRVTGTRATLFNTADYAVYHQEGTRHLPKRTLLLVTRKDSNKLRARLKIGLERALL